MPLLPPSYNWGDEIKNVNETLYRQLNDSYTDVSGIVNTKASVFRYFVDPQAFSQFNMQAQIGDTWVNQTSNTAWIMTSRTNQYTVTWTQIT